MQNLSSTLSLPSLAALRSGLGVPLFTMTLLAMVVVPLPPLALDGLFSFNIAFSLVLLMAVVYVARPLDFGVFPTVLLIATLLRLALNIASTRVVLLEGHTGTGAAGKVIEAFGEFVVGGNYAVGLVVFSILVIINFVVVTKGAGRVSEVSARFTLDAMPGKQMAVDADLNAGALTQEQASQRRREISEEADFYGSMDGASKFVRGDAIAGILILFINIIGGLLIGTMQHGLPLAEALQNYTLLSIGDGLVAQIPSLLLSTAVAIIVTRMSRSVDMGEQVMAQTFGQPQAMAVTGGVLGTLGLVPGMPHLAFLSLATLCGYGAWRQFRQRRVAAQRAKSAQPEAPAKPAVPELSWDNLSPVDPVGGEVGYRLIPLVDKQQGGELMTRIKGVRRKLSEDFGFLVPPVHIRDNLDLAPNAYRILVLGVAVAQGTLEVGRELAINPGQVFGKLPGVETADPAFGLPAVWIDGGARDQAQSLGYTVVDAATVIATHLSSVLQQHAELLLGHEEAQNLLDLLARSSPKLVEGLVPKQLPLAVVAKVFQRLLSEGVSLRDLRTIVETLAEMAPRSQDPDVLLAAARVALGRSIVQKIVGMREDLPVYTLDANLERILHEGLQAVGSAGGLEPGLVDRLVTSLRECAERQQAGGEPTVVLTTSALRPWLARLTRGSSNDLHVLAYDEVPATKQVRVLGAVGG